MRNEQIIKIDSQILIQTNINFEWCWIYWMKTVYVNLSNFESGHDVILSPYMLTRILTVLSCSLLQSLAEVDMR